MAPTIQHTQRSAWQITQDLAEQNSAKQNSALPIVWTIAGSDSGGGAGIQADLATINDLQCHGCSVITTLTAQNSVKVALVEAVSEKMLLAQLNTLAADMPPKAIKIGLLANQGQLNQLASWLRDFSINRTQTLADGSSIGIILDPVMVASSGDKLNQHRLDFSPFKGVISLITPNQMELISLFEATEAKAANVSGTDDKGGQNKLANIQSNTLDGMVHMAKQVSDYFDCNIVAKGGDAPWQGDKAHDVYISQHVIGGSIEHNNSGFILSSNRVNTVNNHGSGCTLSSAIASFLAQNFVLHDAIVLAKAYVNNGLKHSTKLGQGPGCLARTGWPTSLELMPHIVKLAADSTTTDTAPEGASPAVKSKLTIEQQVEGSQAKTAAFNFTKLSTPLGIYPVVSSVDMLEQLLQAGCKTVQLRIKQDAEYPLSSSNDKVHSFVDEQHKAMWLSKYGSGNSISAPIALAPLIATNHHLETHQLEQQQLEQQIQRAIQLGQDFNAQLFINDHWQLALKHGAFGVHLGQEDALVADLSALAANNIALGLSSHSYFEILLATQLQPSYIALGHIFATTTKQMPSKPQGLSKLACYVSLLNGHYPTVAIGGIDGDCLKEVAETGVNNVAVVRAITQAKDTTVAYKSLSEQWQQLTEPSFQTETTQQTESTSQTRSTPPTQSERQTQYQDVDITATQTHLEGI
ncbi:bifunctional hydroxymethylpyrimidine kinase/phosphomethylpyrimidine kinase [Shewanella sp. OMA3-2]|uniref:bifunctional hydroxymethylpyrimidine kinase/phosphomethylpyrimidine kinase n=1 Tax=Shewanella sp. OMA3-2 TaxID=2908650 RepID=UPI001F19ED6D|nr:bifunctional hydroxymethylpyrimidine kinase/phosphomethylpyrimidine kinase [Shewanella sp. OMA3-2]UJF20554.1 bifunctional hydroxymethylpyrimidine kinase/phosphomethylpyrimidine kinase [Shewanella sp. OMA3-2]